MSNDVKKRWNALAAKFNIPSIRGDIHPAMLTSYMARLSQNPDYWGILEAALARRSHFYSSRRFPTFKQAISREFWDDKIRDGGWDCPRHHMKPEGGINNGSTTPKTVLERLAADFEAKHVDGAEEKDVEQLRAEFLARKGELFKTVEDPDDICVNERRNKIARELRGT